jgi:hypothetical protein
VVDVGTDDVRVRALAFAHGWTVGHGARGESADSPTLLAPLS